MTVWDRLVGQGPVIEQLQRAVAGEMTHAWLITGPPGSGRSNAASAFAAALQCAQGGCGDCVECHQVAINAHPDVRLVSTELLSIGVDEVRELVRLGALAPAGGGMQIVIIEDSDRLTEQAANALLKAIEEPNERTAWLLCAPTVEDVLPTIRSRARHVVLSTPKVEEVTEFLVVHEGIAREVAAYAARASQGHIGRAKALAHDDEVKRRRREVVTIPMKLDSQGAAMIQAANLAAVAQEDAESLSSQINAKEKEQLDRSFGVMDRGRKPRGYAPALGELEKAQKARATRRQRDVVDRSLIDLMSVYRDVLTIQLGTDAALVNEELRADLTELGRRTTPEVNLRRIEVILTAREQVMEFNVPPLLALESMMTALR
ncbi:MAG: DNA polymerase III subunit delta' [Nocardioidaceae bacterium]